MSETLEQKPKSTAIAIRAGDRGLELNTFGDMWKFAVAVSQSGMAPRGLEKVEALVTAMQLGAELGFGPMTAVQNICVINGRPTVWGDVMLGLCLDSGLFDEEAFLETMVGGPDSSDWAGVCSCRRLPNGKVITHSFSKLDAKRAGLWDKRGPWQQYPQRMLAMRARSWALRDAFPDVLKGIYSGEEARDIVVDAVPSEEHLAQAREAREAEEETEDADDRCESFEYHEAKKREAAALPAGRPTLDLAKAIIAVGSAAEPEGDAPPEGDGPLPDAPLTSDSEEAEYDAAIGHADSLTESDALQEMIDACGILTDEAKNRLIMKIAARKVVIHFSRGSHSNEPKTE